jgi:predicted deacylase
MPLMIVNGIEDGPAFLVTAAVHGWEYQGVVAIGEVIQAIDPRRFRGKLIAIPGVNMNAFETRTRVGINEEVIMDPNRAAPGKEVGTLTQQLLYAIFERVLPHVSYFLDLHSAGPRIEVGGFAVYQAEYKDYSLDFCKSLGLEVLWTGLGKDGTLRFEALKRGINACSVEIWDVELHKKAITNALRSLGMIDGEPDLPHQYRIVSGHPYYAPCGGIFKRRAGLFDEVRKDDLLGVIVNVFGEQVAEIKAKTDGLVCSLRFSPPLNPGDEVGSVYEVIEVIDRS